MAFFNASDRLRSSLDLTQLSWRGDLYKLAIRETVSSQSVLYWTFEAPSDKDTVFLTTSTVVSGGKWYVDTQIGASWDQNSGTEIEFFNTLPTSSKTNGSTVRSGPTGVVEGTNRLMTMAPPGGGGGSSAAGQIGQEGGVFISPAGSSFLIRFENNDSQAREHNTIFVITEIPASVT